MNKYYITCFSHYCKKMGYINPRNYHSFYEIHKYRFKDINSNRTVHNDINTIYKRIHYTPYQVR